MIDSLDFFVKVDKRSTGLFDYKKPDATKTQSVIFCVISQDTAYNIINPSLSNYEDNKGYNVFVYNEGKIVSHVKLRIDSPIESTTFERFITPFSNAIRSENETGLAYLDDLLQKEGSYIVTNIDSMSASRIFGSNRRVIPVLECPSLFRGLDDELRSTLIRINVSIVRNIFISIMRGTINMLLNNNNGFSSDIIFALGNPNPAAFVHYYNIATKDVSYHYNYLSSITKSTDSEPRSIANSIRVSSFPLFIGSNFEKLKNYELFDLDQVLANIPAGTNSDSIYDILFNSANETDLAEIKTFPRVIVDSFDYDNCKVLLREDCVKLFSEFGLIN